jgi:hypothetical protein
MASQVQAKVSRLLAVTLAGVVVPAFAEIPDSVSPGAGEQIAQIEGRCPSFSWGVVPGAEHYQLVGYRLPEGMEPSEVDLSQADEVLYTEVPGTATSWTPNLRQCLAPGESYVWFVRAVFREDQGEVAEASEWSSGRFFSISPMPSAREVEEALSVLRRYSGQADSGVAATDPRAREAEMTGTQRPAARQRRAIPPPGPKSVTTAKTAIKGSLSDTTGETYGVVGVSASADGAGLGAVNTAGGPDFVLDGSADLLPDTLLSESGIDRPWGTDVTFNLQNSADGGMTLQVDGVEVVTTATDHDTVGGLSCATDEVAKWNGSAWACAPDVDTDTLAGLTCALGQVAKWSGSDWVCFEDWDTLYSLGCSTDQIPKWNGSAWTCAPDETDTFWAANGDHIHNANVGNVGIGTTSPVGQMGLGEYQGGTSGSVVAGHAKQMVLGGTYDTAFNDGSSVKLLISDYDNDTGADIYPIYVEDENNLVDFYVRKQDGHVSSAYFGGSVGIGTAPDPDTPLYLFGGDDVGPTGGGDLVLGAVAGYNLAFDNNEIMARNNDATSTLYLNNNGGDVIVGEDLLVNGKLDIGYEILTETEYTSPAYVTVECPVGKKLLGGGCNCVACSGVGLTWNAPSALGDYWMCKATFVSGGWLYAAAICARVGDS